ncbi:MAG: N-acyl amino acid synthase FeeM domain-containing protein, partial [Casimicrobium sp.]
YHLLPTTTIAVAKYRGEVVGTVSIIKDSPLGLPTDEIVNIDALRNCGNRIAEGSSIAVVPKHRNGRAMYLLMKFLHNYLWQCCGVRYLVVTSNPRHEDLYLGILCFDRLSGETVHGYSFAKGADAVPMVLDLSEAAERFRLAYVHRNDDTSMYRFLFERSVPEISLPPKQHRLANHSAMSADWIHKLFLDGLLTEQLRNPAFVALLKRVHGIELGRGFSESASRLFADVRMGEFWAVNCHGILRAHSDHTVSTTCRVFCIFDKYVDILGAGASFDRYPPAGLLSIGRGAHASVCLSSSLPNGRMRYRVTQSSAGWNDIKQVIDRRNVEGDAMSVE